VSAARKACLSRAKDNKPVRSFALAAEPPLGGFLSIWNLVDFATEGSPGIIVYALSVTLTVTVTRTFSSSSSLPVFIPSGDCILPPSE
jgi:hypothetical protein